jgi:predicted RNase H-like HicB family nuclease
MNATGNTLLTNGPHARVTAMKYSVALMRTEEGFSVSCLGLPGCWSQGATEEEALSNIQDAIRTYVQVDRQIAGQHN